MASIRQDANAALVMRPQLNVTTPTQHGSSGTISQVGRFQLLAIRRKDVCLLLVLRTNDSCQEHRDLTFVTPRKVSKTFLSIDLLLSNTVGNNPKYMLIWQGKRDLLVNLRHLFPKPCAQVQFLPGVPAGWNVPIAR